MRDILEKNSPKRRWLIIENDFLTTTLATSCFSYKIIENEKLKMAGPQNPWS